MATISVCMIVKNEEKVLERCLKSLEGLWDELVIIDTGSTDNTKKIASRYTDKIYDFVWTGSFSDARNFSFSKASCEYIYAADADEELDEENRNRFKVLKEALVPEIEIVQMYYGNQLSQNTIYNYDMEYRPKLYKRLRSFLWQEPIHEAVRLDPVVYDSDIVIWHKPQGEHGSRDLEAFESMIERKDTISLRLRDIYFRELYFMGNIGNYKKAEEYLKDIITKEDPAGDDFQKAVVLLMKKSVMEKKEDDLLKYSLKGGMTKGCSEFCLLLGDYFFDREDYEEASLWYYNAIHETEPLMSLKAGGKEPEEKLELCYKRLGVEFTME